MDGWMIDDRLFTSGFLPRDLGLGETVGFALDASVGALSECLVGGFQDPAGWYWIQNSQVIRNVPRANRVGQLSGSQSLLVVISSSFTNFFSRSSSFYEGRTSHVSRSRQRGVSSRAERNARGSLPQLRRKQQR